MVATSKRLQVFEAIVSLVSEVWPTARVLGLDNDVSAPQRVPAGGQAIVRTGDPGDPEIDLSPLTYNYEHRFPVELSKLKGASASAEAAIDEMFPPLGAAIEQNRTLGGLCNWLEAEAPLTEDIYTGGADVPRAADFVIVAHYATSNPLI